jgi:hypothetical protein
MSTDTITALPTAAVAAVQLAVDLERQARYEAAIDVLRAALDKFPGLTDIQWRLALLLLREGAFEEGWRLFETRPINMGGRDAGKPTLSMPEWDGRPVQSLLILQEQGLGDQIMFARYAAHFRDQGLQVAILCHPLLVRLFQRLGSGVQVISGQGRVALPNAEAWALGPSLPFLSGVAPSKPYLRAATGGRGVGVLAQGNPGHVNDMARSLPDDVAAELAAWPGVTNLAQAASGAADLEDTARLIDGLDVVVTVDTAVAHLAGAMGKPTFMMLPFVPDWRWLRDRADTPWYPTMRLFRQPAPGDWASVVHEVRAALDTHGS